MTDVVSRGAALGTAAVVLPLRHPLHVAKAAWSLDRLSGGRFILGVGSGDRPEELAPFGVARNWGARSCLGCAQARLRSTQKMLGDSRPGLVPSSRAAPCRSASRARGMPMARRERANRPASPASSRLS